MTDYEDPTTFDRGFYESLSPNDQDRFEDDFKHNLSDFDASAIKRTLKAEYDRQDEHLKLVKATSACFHVRGGVATNSGFKLYGVNPLCGIHETQADIVAVNNEHNCVYLLIVFCEIGGERMDEWVKNVNEAHRFFSKPETKDALRQKLNINTRDIEIGYVTLTREDDTVGMDFSILSRQCDANPYAVWECDTGDRWIRHVEGSLPHPDLESEFASDLDYSRRKEPINFISGTHPIFPLERNILKIVSENKTFNTDPIDEFDRDTFLDFHSDELKVFCTSNNEDAVKEAEADRILSAGVNSRILTDKPSELEEGDYKVVYSGARGPEHAKNAVEPRYFKYMPQYEVGKRAFKKTKDEFNKSSGLSDFV
ncbi:hypothetical protein [Halorussus halophilus]|uniref:hypothetical protein n=1 Tax=Halorussus halophilus TaxID=2650975 RepID=UPI00130178FA|nr:hypothetical protein [Halorussus halophilus]